MSELVCECYLLNDSYVKVYNGFLYEISMYRYCKDTIELIDSTWIKSGKYTRDSTIKKGKDILIVTELIGAPLGWLENMGYQPHYSDKIVLKKKMNIIKHKSKPVITRR